MSLTILGQKMPTLSPSQMETAECTMQWYFQYVEGIAKEQKRSASDGNAIDAIVTEAINTGRRPTTEGWGIVALVALDFLWRKGVRAQVPVNAVPFGGGLFGGWTEGRQSAIDVLDMDRLSEPTERDDRGNPIPHVMDLKTTGKKKWIKTREMLEKDIQVLIYARAASLWFEERYGYLPERVDCSWLYVIRNTKNPQSFPVEFFLTQEMISDQEEEWRPAIGRALVMALKATRGQFRKEDARKNLLCCEKYGGCSYGPKFKGVCELTPQELYMADNQTQLSPAQLAEILTTNGVSMPPAGPTNVPQNGGLPQPVQQELPTPQQQIQQSAPAQMTQDQQYAAWQAQQAQAQQQAAWQAQQAQAAAQAQAQQQQAAQYAAWQAQQAAQQAPPAAQPYQASPTSAGFQQSVQPTAQGGPWPGSAMTAQQAPVSSVPPGVDPAQFAEWQRRNGIGGPPTAQGATVYQMGGQGAPAAQPTAAPTGKKRGRPTKEEAAAKKAARAAQALATGAPPPAEDDDELADVLDALADVLGALARRARGE